MPQQFIQNPLNQFELERLPVGWPWRFLATAFFIFLSSLLIYFGLVFGYEPYLNSQIQSEDKELDQLAQTVSKEDREKFTQFYSQLVNLQNLLGNHIAASKAFPILERITSHKVYYRSVDLKIPERQLELDGIAESYEVLGEQLESFNQAAEMENSLVNQSQLVNQAVQFKATLLLKDNVLK